MTEREILEGMLEVLSSPDKWVKGAYGLTEEGGVVWGTHPDAVQFCLTGAFQRVTNTQHTAQLFGNPGPYTEKAILTFNDNPETTYEDVILFLRNRIKELENG